jgi:hypothetical protein
MSSILRPSTVDDESQIIEFLARVFVVGHDADFVNPALLRWKYWEPRGDCPDPRSFVIEKNGRIVAHVGLWPVTVRTEAGNVRGVHMIDWASDPQAPGAGVSLLQRLTKLYDFIYAIGGSEMTQTILPKFGFRPAGTALTLARPLRPLRQILHHQSRDVRLPIRLARNVWWSATPARAPMPGWLATEAADGDLDELAARSCERDGSFLRYLQRCPAARLLVFHILNEGRKSGFFALSVVGAQTRVAGLWMENPTPANWRIAFQLAQDAALRCTDTSELVARTADETGSTAATQAGLRLRMRTPVFLFRRGDGQNGRLLHFQMWDNDFVFLGSGRTEFLT